MDRQGILPCRPMSGPPRRAKRDAVGPTARGADAERAVSRSGRSDERETTWSGDELTPNSWTSPATIAEAHAWLLDAATAAGRRVTGPIEQPHVRPWSTVFRAPTDQGAVYLKLCGPSQD